MRTESEVREAFEAVGERDECPADWKGDNFKYGYFAGRVAALAWVLGDPSYMLTCDYDYEDYVAELRSNLPGGET